MVETSALKGGGGKEAAEAAVSLARNHKAAEPPHVFTGSVEHALAHIEESIEGKVNGQYLRWYAIKIFERDETVMEELYLSDDLKAHLEQHITDCEKELDDDGSSNLLGHSTSEITELYYVRKDTSRLAGITAGFEL